LHIIGINHNWHGVSPPKIFDMVNGLKLSPWEPMFIYHPRLSRPFRRGAVPRTRQRTHSHPSDFRTSEFRPVQSPLPDRAQVYVGYPVYKPRLRLAASQTHDDIPGDNVWHRYRRDDTKCGRL